MPYRTLPLGPTGHTVATNIRILRKAHGLSQAQLAEKASETAHTGRLKIQAIEAGYRRVDVDDLTAIATALGVPPEKLLEPWQCDTCHGTPPPRFTCSDCGTKGT